MRGRDLVLPMAELGVVLLDRDALRVQRGDEVIDVVLRRGGPDGREAQRRVDGDVGAVQLGRERELGLERRAQGQVVGGQRRLHALQERALADRGGRPLAGDVVRQHRSGVGRVGQDAERVEVGHEPDLAHRPERGDGLQLVERAYGLHGHREPDAGAQPSLQAVAPGRLGPHGAVVPAPQEAEEAQTGLVELRDDVVDAHARKAKAARRARCRDPAAAASGSRRGRSRPSRRARRCAGGAAERVDEDLVGRRDGRDAAVREVPVGCAVLQELREARPGADGEDPRRARGAARRVLPAARARHDDTAVGAERGVGARRPPSSAPPGWRSRQRSSRRR